VPDVFTKKKRSQVMAAIRSRGNKDTELKLASILRTARITGWRRHQPLAGRPDFVFHSARIAVFVDGCFWHGCPKHGRKPGSNRAYWLPKLRRNQRRDRAVTRALSKAGWHVIRLWEHDLANPAQAGSRIIRALTRLQKPGK
jgi:DNA mismatch endonuclease (patch repair protein)